FDLLLSIYEEAWNDPDAKPYSKTGQVLRDEYRSLESLRLHLPELILRHNLYGIDIDQRAAQIAALALWLRAQRTYQELGVARDQRPSIKRINIVVAEPMPGDARLVSEFAQSLDPP